MNVICLHCLSLSNPVEPKLELVKRLITLSLNRHAILIFFSEQCHVFHCKLSLGETRCLLFINNKVFIHNRDFTANHAWKWVWSVRNIIVYFCFIYAIEISYESKEASILFLFILVIKQYLIVFNLRFCLLPSTCHCSK